MTQGIPVVVTARIQVRIDSGENHLFPSNRNQRLVLNRFTSNDSISRTNGMALVNGIHENITYEKVFHYQSIGQICKLVRGQHSIILTTFNVSQFKLRHRIKLNYVNTTKYYVLKNRQK